MSGNWYRRFVLRSAVVTGASNPINIPPNDGIARTESANEFRSLSDRTVRIAFTTAVAIVLVIGTLSYRSVGTSAASNHWVQHTRDVLKNIEMANLSMETVASSVRGFVITGDETYLDDYRAGIVGVRQYQAALRDLTVDNPGQQRRVSMLEKLAAGKIERGEVVIGLRKSRGIEAAADEIQHGPSQQTLTEYKTVIHEMLTEEDRLMISRTAEANKDLNQIKIILIAGTLAGLLITGAAGLIVQHDSTKRRLTEAALRDSEEKYRRLIQGVQEYGIFMMGPRGEIHSWNPGAARMTGFAFEEIDGHNFSRFFSSDDVESGKPEEILRLAAANGIYEDQGIRVRKDGSRLLMRSSFTASRDQTGNLRGFSVICQRV